MTITFLNKLFKPETSCVCKTILNDLKTTRNWQIESIYSYRKSFTHTDRKYSLIIDRADKTVAISGLIGFDFSNYEQKLIYKQSALLLGILSDREKYKHLDHDNKILKGYFPECFK